MCLNRAGGGEGIEDLLQRHRQIQEKVAEDMIDMARSLRAHSEAAKKIIAEDVQVSASTLINSEMS